MVVPLQVVIGATSYDEGAAHPRHGRRGAQGVHPGVDLAADAGGDGGRLRRPRSRTAPRRSSRSTSPRDMSGTFDSARGGRARRVRCRCSRSTPGRSASPPGTPCWRPPPSPATGARPRRWPPPRWPGPTATTSLFYVDTLEYLRRGGRVGAAAALLGSALAVKPLLTITDGKVASLEKVRTAARALARLEDLAVEAAGDAAGRDHRGPPGQPRARRAAGREAHRAGWSWPRRCGSPSSARCSARTSGRAWSRSAWHRRSTDPRGRPQAGCRAGWRGPGRCLASPHASSRYRPRRRRLPTAGAAERRAGRGAARRAALEPFDLHTHIRPPAAAPGPAPRRLPEPGPPAIPVPGRHAARRSGWSPGGPARGAGRARPRSAGGAGGRRRAGPRHHRVVGAPRRWPGRLPRARLRPGGPPRRPPGLAGRARRGSRGGRGGRRRDRQGAPPGHRGPRARCPGGRRPRRGRGSPSRCRPGRAQPGPAPRRRRADRGRGAAAARRRPPPRRARRAPTRVPW